MPSIMAFSKLFRQENVLVLAFPKVLDIVAFMVELETTSQVIDALGGNAAVSELTGSNMKAVSMWKTAGKFPWRTQLPIVEALRECKKTAPQSLWGMKQKISSSVEGGAA